MEIEIKTPQLQVFVEENFQRLGLKLNNIFKIADFLEKDEDAIQLALSIMRLASIEEKFCQAAIYGVPVEGFQFTNWASCYQMAIIWNAIVVADRFMQGDQRCEVGLKYAEFDFETVKAKYNLLPPQSCAKDFGGEYIRKYAIWQNEDKSVSFSCREDRNPEEADYIGMTFPTCHDGYEFIKSFLANPDWDVTDVDFLTNQLGGLRLTEIDQFNLQSN